MKQVEGRPAEKVLKYVHMSDSLHKTLLTALTVEDTVLSASLWLAATACWLPSQLKKRAEQTLM